MDHSLARPTPLDTEEVIDLIKWDRDGLVAAIVQDAGDGTVLMMAWMDVDAVRRTLQTRQTHFYSRSRKSSWHKGGSSGHVQDVESVAIDCDGDALLIKARQVGGACHEGYRSCFFRQVGGDGRVQVAAEPVFEPIAVYGAPGDPGR